MNNKFLSIAASTAIVASALVFTGCGSDSSTTTAATTTTTTAPTTLTGTAVKGPWSNVTYTVTANGTLANTTGTLTAGAFTFGTTADNVTIDLGMAKWKIVNPTSGSMFSFLNMAQEGNKLLRTNGTEYTAAQYANVIDNLLLTTLTFENDTAALESTTTAYNAGTLISRFAALQARGLDLTEASATFQTSLATNLTAANLTAVNKTSVATAATSMAAYKTAIKTAYGTAMAATYNSLNSLNATNLNNTFIIVSNATGKYVIDMTNTGGSAVTGNSNITTGVTALTALGSTTKSNASGSTIVYGQSNTSSLLANYSVFTSSLAGLRTGATVKMRYVDANGEMREYTVNAIRTNLSTWGDANSVLGKKAINVTLTDSYGNPKLLVNHSRAQDIADGSSAGVNTSVMTYRASDNTWNNITTTNANASMNLSSESGMVGLNTTLCLYNATTPAVANSYMNLTFDFDAAGSQNGGNGTYANGGTIATIVNTIDTALAAISKFFLSLYSRIG